MRAETRILFSLYCGSGSDLETNLGQQLFQIVGDLLVEAVQLCAPLLLKLGVAGNGLKESGGQGCIDSLEQFQENHTDRVPRLGQPVAPSAFDLFDEAFGPELQ